MNTQIQSRYRRGLCAGLLIALLLVAGGAYIVGLFYLDVSHEPEPVEPVRRQGCTCPTDRTLPTFVLNTHGQDIHILPKKQKAAVYGTTMELYEPSPRYTVDVEVYEPQQHGYTCTCGAADPTVTRSAVISLRGQSSLSFEKKQYTLNFLDEDGNAQPLPLLGMPGHHQWVLNGSYTDKSLLRNALALTIAGQTMAYAPRYEFCEVLLNTGEGPTDFDEHYIGVYLLMEKIERNADRVNILRADTRYSDLSFIIARDKLKLKDTVLLTDWGVLEEDWIVGANGQLRQRTMLVASYPGASMTEDYKQRIIDYLNEFEYALGSRNFADASTGYRKYVDVNSFIHLAMVNELFKNVDGGEISTYFYKDLGGKLKAGPVWDFDLTLGNSDIQEMQEPTGLRMIDVNWYVRMFQDDYFADRYERTYRGLRNDKWSNSTMVALIDELVEELGAAAERNALRWYAATESYAHGDYDAEVRALTDFLITRMEWMDRNIHLVHRINEDHY